MRARELFIALSLTSGCGEIREVPVESGDDGTSAAVDGGQDETTSSETGGADETGTTEAPPDIDDASGAGSSTDTGAAEEVEWMMFCTAEPPPAASPSSEVVVPIDVEDVEIRSDFRIGIRVHNVDEGLRITAAFDGEEVILMDFEACVHGVSAQFTDGGTNHVSTACDELDNSMIRTVVPMEPLAPLLEGNIGGTWELRYQAENATDQTPLITTSCISVATPI